jgi:cold-inducible RNA-binding protein
MKKLFVGGINFNTTEDVLKEAFSYFGKIVKLRLIRDRETGKSRGFAFIVFLNESDAEKAKNAMNGVELDGRMIGVKDAKDKVRNDESKSE